ncbi:MAG: hypothetical protein ABGZ53_08570 [Fuerstiella sp.]
MKPTSSNTEIVEGVQFLHSIFKPAATIAKRMHYDLETVEHIIQHGTVPHRQLPLLWRDEPPTSPEHPAR